MDKRPFVPYTFVLRPNFFRPFVLRLIVFRPFVLAPYRRSIKYFD